MEACHVAWEELVNLDDAAEPFSPSKSAKRRLRRRRQIEAMRSAGDSNTAVVNAILGLTAAPSQLRSVVSLEDIGVDMFGAYGKARESQTDCHAAPSALSAVAGIASPCRVGNRGFGVNHGSQPKEDKSIAPLAIAPTSPTHSHNGALFASPQAGDASARTPPSHWQARCSPSAEAAFRLLIGGSTPHDLLARLEAAAPEIYED